MGFVGKIIELSSIIDLSNYINRLEECNLRILRLLENSMMEINSSLDILNPEFDDLKKRVDYIYSDDANPMNLKLLIERKSKLPSDEFKEKYPNFQEIEHEYKKII